MEIAGMSAKDAESIADAWMHARNRGILGISYWTASKEGEDWVIQGEVELAQGLFATQRKEFKVRVTESGAVQEFKE